MTLELAVRTAAILSVAWIVARLLSRATAATRYVVWQAALALVLAAPMLMPAAPTFTVPAVADATRLGALLGPDVAVRESATRDAVSARTTPSSAVNRDGSGSRSDDRLVNSVERVTAMAPLAWAIGASALALWFLLGWALTAISTRAAPPAPLLWQRELDALRQRLGVSRPVALRMYGGHTSPLAVGLWRPAILLPEAARSWAADRRQSVLLHELAHIKRADCRTQAMAQAACVVYWFNPLVWRAFAALRSERERACDDEVLKSGARPSDYAAHLLEIARDLRPAPRPTAALAMARPTELEGRLLAVLAADRARPPARHARRAVVLILTVVTTLILGAMPSGRAASAPASSTARRSPPLYMAAPDTPTLAERVADYRVRQEASAVLASSRDADARERAVLELAASGQVEAVAPLEAALADEDQEVREKAALGLALSSRPDVIPALLTALSDPSSQVREKAAMGLAFRRDPRVVEALLPALDDADSQVREKVAMALGASGDPRAEGPLARALNDPDGQVREKAAAGLALLHGSATNQVSGDQLRDGLRGLVGTLLRLTR